MDSHTTGPGFKTVLSTGLLTDYHHNSIKFAGVCGRSGKEFPVGSHPRH